MNRNTIIISLLLLITSAQAAVFDKFELKHNIEEVDPMFLKVSLITYENNLLNIEYSSYALFDSGIFGEQIQIINKTITYVQIPTEIRLKHYYGRQEAGTIGEVYITTLTWEQANKLKNLELSNSEWKTITKIESIAPISIVTPIPTPPSPLIPIVTSIQTPIKESPGFNTVFTIIPIITLKLILGMFKKY